MAARQGGERQVVQQVALALHVAGAQPVRQPAQRLPCGTVSNSPYDQNLSLLSMLPAVSLITFIS